MRFIKSLFLAFSMFSRIPSPKTEWNEDNMRYLLAAFPLVGAAIGLVLMAWFGLSEALGFGDLLFAAGLTVIPVLVTGGIHLDGFCDTVDARRSYGTPEKKREILKDPHAGAFAVIYVCVYLLTYFGLATAVPRTWQAVLCLGLMAVVSRSMSAVVSIISDVAGEKGLLSAFHGAAEKRNSLIISCVWMVLAVVFMALSGSRAFGVMLLAAAFVGLYVQKVARKEFGGMRGDLAGYLLQLAEIWMLTAMVFVEKALTAWF